MNIKQQKKMKKEETLVFRVNIVKLRIQVIHCFLTFQFSKIPLSRFIQLVRLSTYFWIVWIRAAAKREVSFARKLIRIFSTHHEKNYTDASADWSGN